MRVHALELKHFRNYDELSLPLSPGKNMFLGANGQGKTNLLEAVYFLSHARSHRTHSDRELIQAGSRFAAITAQLAPHAYEGRMQLDARITLDGGNGEGDRLKTIFRVNGTPLRSRSELLGNLPTVSFFLPDLLLLRGNPEDRRRWLDAAIVQYDKRHLSYLSDFQKIRLQKNRLLKEAPERIDPEHLSVWNARFAEAASRLIASRQRYLAMIADLAAAAYLELSDAREHLSWTYAVSGLPENIPVPETPEAIETTLKACLETARREEIRRATSLYGPHRDDIRFYLNDMEAAAYGSQGQQRCIVLALKLTELKCLSARLQEPPVLLLDDVMAELDPDRQRLLVEHIDPQSQVLITTTHPADSWQSLLSGELAVYQVTRGRVEPAHAEAYRHGR